MKRPLTIILTVVAVIAILSLSLMRLMGPKIGNTFSTISYDLPYGSGGGGAPQMDLYAAEEPAAMPEAAFDSSRQSITDVTNQAQQQVERKVIKNADLAVVVQDPEASMKAISALAESLGGYVVSSSMSQQNYGPNMMSLPSGNISIRIPAEKLTEVMDQIKADAVEITSENVYGQDVTDQYVDLQSRLTALQAAEKKLLEILEDASETEDVLSVYEQLRQVQSEIEVLKGQIKYIDQSVAMSSLSVYLVAEESVQPIQVGPWKPSGAAKDAVEDLVYFFQNFVEFLIRFLIFTLPALILVAIPLALVYFAGRAIYRRFFRRNKVELSEEEKK